MRGYDFRCAIPDFARHGNVHDKKLVAWASASNVFLNMEQMPNEFKRNEQEEMALSQMAWCS